VRCYIKLLVVILFTIFACTPARDIAFTLKPGVGSRYSGEITVNSSLKIPVGGKAATTTQQALLVFSMEVKEQAKNGVRMELRYDRMQISMQSGPINYRYDTATGEGNAELGILNGFTGKSFYILFSEYGELLDISGINIILNSLIKKEDLTQSLLSLLLAFFDEARVKENFRSMFRYFPDKPVKPGSRWSIIDTIDREGLTFSSKNTWYLKRAGKEFLDLQLTAQIRGKDPRVEVSGSQEGKLTVNRDTGIPQKGVIFQKMNGYIPGTDKQKTKVEITGETVFTFREM